MRVELTLDCVDLERVAAFWQAALRGERGGVIEGRYVHVHGPHVSLTLQRVPEPKTGKNRMHLDLLVPDVDAEVARLRSIGATLRTPVAHREFGQTWFVLADPEGNEFCVAHEPE